MVKAVEIGEHFETNNHEIVCARNLLRVKVQYSGVRLFAFTKQNFECKRRQLNTFNWNNLTEKAISSTIEMGNLKRARVQWSL